MPKSIDRSTLSPPTGNRDIYIKLLMLLIGSVLLSHLAYSFIIWKSLGKPTDFNRIGGIIQHNTAAGSSIVHG